MRHVARGLVLSLRVALATFALATPAQAQMPSIGVPKGQLRIELGGEFATVNGGALAEAWRADLGANFLPELGWADTRIRAITGNASYQLSAGRSSVTASTQTGRGTIAAALGLTKRLTIFGNLPFVRARAQNRLAFDTTAADAGINPADPIFGTPAGRLQSQNFIAEFQRAIDTVTARYNAGAYDADATKKAQAADLMANGPTLLETFSGLLLGPLVDPLSGGAPFVPIASSAAGAAILATVNALQGTVSGLGWNGFTTDPALAAHRLSEQEFRDYLSSPGGEVASIYRGNNILQRPGDAEVGMVYTVIDRPDLRIAATGLVRLPTGLLDRSENFFDLGTGDGQTDLEGRIAADLARGRVGARLTAGYNRQLQATLQRRVFAPSQPLALAYRAAEVTRDPGDEITIGIEPFVRLAPGFAFSVGALHWSHGADQVSYSGTAVPGVAASDLAIDTKRSATMLQTGLTYSSFAGIHGKGAPIEARWAYRSVISTSGGQVDKTKTMWFQFRAYYKLW